MMKTCISYIWILFSISSLFAHPGIGLLYDGGQYIYYTDLDQVWKLDIHTEEKVIAVPNVHSHELAMDSAGNLYGEHYYFVSAEEKFKHYIWQLHATEGLKRIREERDGENYDFSFVRDAQFAGYKLRRGDSLYQIVKRDTAGLAVMAQAKLNHPVWKYLSGRDILYIADYPSVYKLENDTLSLLSEEIAVKSFPFSTQRKQHHIYGMWTDSRENVYVAVYGGRRVRKIDKEGHISTVVKSPMRWSPVNGLFDAEGNLWLMESTLAGKVRVRKIRPRELAISPVAWRALLIFAIGLLVFVVVAYKVWKSSGARKKMPLRGRIGNKLKAKS